MVVLKSSIRNHFVGVHSMSKEDAAAITIYTKSELIAEGHQIPSGLKPSRITSNIDAATYSSKKYALNLNAPGTTTLDKVNDSTKVSEEVKREAGPVTIGKVSTPAYPPLTTPGVPTASQVSGSPDAVSDSRKRYALSLHPPGLAESDQGSGPFGSKSVKDPPAIGGVFSGVNMASGQLSATSNAERLGQVTDPSAASNAPITPVAAQIVSTVPAKRKYEAATTLEVHAVLDGGAHKPTSQKIPKLTGQVAAAQPNGVPNHVTIGQTHLGWDSLSPGLKDALNNILIQVQTQEKIIPWMTGVNESLRQSREEGRTFSAHELMAVARAALTEVSDYMHDTDSSDGPEVDFLSPHLAARTAVISAVDYHQGGIAAASMEREIDAMAKDDGGRGEKEESPHKWMKMSYGEILVPCDYAPDERQANVDERDEATDAEGHAGPGSSQEPVERDEFESVVEVFDDQYTNEGGFKNGF
jgi:hypothetical protein